MLPFASPSASSSAGPSAPPDGNRRILLIDDNPAIHEDIRKILDPGHDNMAALDDLEAEIFASSATRPGVTPAPRFDIDSAYQGREGLELLRAARRRGAPYAVAFVDVRMPPGWDGIETISQLWKEDQDLQVVICTAYSDHSWGDIMSRLAPTDGLLILRKPFDSVEIRQMAHALTAKWSLQRQADDRLRALQTEVHVRTRQLDDTATRLARETHERQRVERELRLAHKLEGVGLVASGIAHEISTPIQFLGESADLLRSAFEAMFRQNEAYRTAFARMRLGAWPSEVEPEVQVAEAERSVAELRAEIEEGLVRVLEGSSRITSIVRAMKEFMYPETSEPQPADLNRALLNTLTVARNEYKYVAEVKTELAALPPVTCQVGELNQVFLNLLVNAAHAVGEVVERTKALGRITVRSRLEGGDSVVVSVEDTGPGIAPEIRERIFDPFFTTKKAGQGTGQGLAIARALVERHGGEIWFESEVGRGTTFFVRLPVGQSQTPGRRAA